MDLRKIKKLIDLLEESNLAEIEIREGEESVRLARVPQGSLVTHAPHVVHAPASPAPMPMASPTEASSGGSPAKAQADLPDGELVRAPMSARTTPRRPRTSRRSSPSARPSRSATPSASSRR